MAPHRIYGRFGITLLTSLGLAPIACETDGEQGRVFPCTDSTPVEIDGQDSGFATCNEDYKHRPSANTCPVLLPRADPTCDIGDVAEKSCETDADCTAASNGVCLQAGGQLLDCQCRYGCETDADCGAGQICECGEPVGHCINADCTTDADCEGDLKCIRTTVGDAGCGGLRYACQRLDDECASNVDCPTDQYCVLDGEARACREATCVAGRPFLVADEVRLAPAAPRDDWCAEDLEPEVGSLSAEERQLVAAHWTQSGLMEHASVAAFARFALQLMSLGAPADLLERTQAAMADELRHARLCFAVARAYAGAPVGPGSLAVAGALDDCDRETVLRLTIREGCVGETVAAVEAHEAASRVADPVLREVLEGIADDELRHAALAWQFVRWMLQQDPSATRVLEEELVEARRDEVVAASDEPALEAQGVLSSRTKRALRQAALREVVGPVAAGVLRGQPALPRSLRSVHA